MLFEHGAGTSLRGGRWWKDNEEKRSLKLWKQPIRYAWTLLLGLDSLRRGIVPLIRSPIPYRYDEIWSRKGFI